MMTQSDEIPMCIDKTTTFNNWCIHCSIPLNHSNDEYNDQKQKQHLKDGIDSRKELDDATDLTQKLDEVDVEPTQKLEDNVEPTQKLDNSEPTQLSSSSAVSRQWLRNALSSVFKLDYLNAFANLEQDQNEESDEQIQLCQNCNEVLKNLYQLYNDFLELSKIDSYLARKLARLDEIIDCHLQKTISCDLIVAGSKNESEGDVDNFTDLQAMYNHETKFQNSKLNTSQRPVNRPSILLKKEDFTKDSPEKSLILGREPRIVLKRLPVKYSRARANSHHHEDQDFTDSDDDPADHDFVPSGNDDESMDHLLLPEIILKMEEDTMNTENGEDCDFAYGPKKSSRSNQKKSVKTRTSTTKFKTSKQTRKGSNRKSSAKSTKTAFKKETKSHEDDSSSDSILEDETMCKSKSKKQSKDDSRRTKNKKKSGKQKTSHYLAKKRKAPNPCWYCKRTDFATPADCVEHTKNEHLSTISKSSNSRVCERCAKICFNDSSLVLHMKRCELIPSGVIMPKTYQCQECPKSFGFEKGLQSHMLTHSTDRPFLCDECPYRSKSLQVLKGHKINKHTEPGNQQKVKCDECNTFVKNLSLHKINMHTAEGYQKYRERQTIILAKQKAERMVKSITLSTICADCNVDFFSRLALINHRRTSHGDNMGKEFTCHLCGRDFTAQRSLKLHTQRVHSDERPYICEQCGKGFKVNYNLKAHVEQTHTEEGRLKYNAQMRERNRRMKLRARQLENIKQQQQIHNTIPIPITTTIATGISLGDFWQSRDGLNNNFSLQQ